ncbi:MAG: hypothetical protein HQK74_06640, partial [Desulfamplus sp.]|nr:hypothetical protein [Desulfamplus sp.]
QNINIFAQDVKECDTAYLQMLLSLKATAEHQGVLFKVKTSSDVIDEIWSLYSPPEEPFQSV